MKPTETQLQRALHFAKRKRELSAAARYLKRKGVL